MSARPPTTRWIALVPNALSVFRIVLAAVFPLFEGYWRAVVILVVALSDGADGFIARRYNATSWIGGLLDAFADKLFILVVLATLLAGGELRWWEAALLLSRDISVLLVAAYVAGMRLWAGFRKMPARPLGKATTAALFLLILLLALWGDARPQPVSAVMALTIALSLLAALDYLALFLRAEHARRTGQPSPVLDE